MDCAHVEELLPWLLNGTLPAVESAGVREHLARCAACREARAETAWVADLAAHHVPAGGLLDLAAGVRLPAEERVEIEAHLASCAACAAELELVRQSWVELEAPETVPAKLPGGRSELARPDLAFGPRPRPKSDWRTLALAASLAGMILGGFGFWQMRLQAAGEQARQAAEVERSRRAADEARRGRATAEAQVARLQEPQLNAGFAELMPVELVLRGAATPLPVLAVPAAGRITLLLAAPPAGPEKGEYGVELRDAQGRVVWAARGLERQALGEFSLSLPAELLPEGPAEIRLFPPDESEAASARYRFQVRHGRAERSGGSRRAPR